jgi:hypothetical protein
VRQPLLGEPASLALYLVNIGMLIAGSALTFILFNRKRNRIAFWV